MSLRVLIVNLGLVPGLASRELLERLPALGRFAAALVRADAEVIVLARAEDEADREEEGVRLISVADGGPSLPRLRSTVRPVLQKAAKLSPEVVHVGGLVFPVPTLALRAILPRNVPLLLQHHGEPPGTGRLGLLQRLCLRSADGALFTSREIARDWTAGGHLPRSMPVHEVLEASTDMAPVSRTTARAETGIEGSPAVLWVGRLHPRKDPLTALRLFEQVLVRLPDARLHLVFGEAPLLPEVRRIVEGSPLLSRAVRFVGKVENERLPAWYSAADLFLTTSPAEGSNWALIEATACGLPAVASEIPANRRVAGELGTFFPAGDAPAGAEAVVLATSLRNDARREALRLRFQERLSWKVVVTEALAAYRAAMARRVPA